MLSDLVRNNFVHMGFLRVLFVRTVVFLFDYRGPPCTYSCLSLPMKSYTVGDACRD